MAEKYKVAVLGAGPAGMSAAARAAEQNLTHVLVENTEHHAHTIQLYQKGKHVMAEPEILPLRSPIEFEAGTREAILGAWEDGLKHHNVNTIYSNGCKSVSGEEGHFKVGLNDGTQFEAEHVVLSIGVQGNPRRLESPGDHFPCVQYQLDDPDEYHEESIVVVGAGDSALENAMGLMGHNKVYIVNRRDEFARAKEGNLNLILKAIDDKKITCYYKSTINRVEETQGSEKPYKLVLNTAQGEAEIPCDRIIARLGAVPQRNLVEGFGVQFPNDDPAAIPVLTSQYESNVKGLYIIGALGGYPLIKQAMNQGWETIEYLLGNDVKPADHPLLEAKFKQLPYELDVDEILTLMQERIPVFADINTLLFREMMIDSDIRMPKKGEVVFYKNDYTDTFFTILDGNISIDVGPDRTITTGQGEFFGEMSLLSGRRRSATVRAGENCVLIETPRRIMNKLINSTESVRRIIDETFIVRALQSKFAPNSPLEDLQEVAHSAKLNVYKPGDALFKEGDDAESFHIVRSGSLCVEQILDGRTVVHGYVASGNYVGEMGLLGNSKRSATVRANVATETISLDSDTFKTLLNKAPELKQSFQSQVRNRLVQNSRVETRTGDGDLLSFLMSEGLGEATDVLLIDESLCIGCDNCEVACAETHGGTSRLNREAGQTYASIHVPTSCRHCEDPHCMQDCPPDALRRSPNGEVYIQDNCIGCGNCEQNCPYDVIHMAYPAPKKPGLWSWLLFGAGPGPGEIEGSANKKQRPQDMQMAVKCDMCMNVKGGAACVRACPTGAAIRINPDQFGNLVAKI